MSAISFCFEVHQPTRLRRSFFWDGKPLCREPGELYDFYFDETENRAIFNRISQKCYLPANKLILELILKSKESDRPFKVAYSISGIYIEQCKKHNPEVLDSFIKLFDTGNVELMEQTYCHSLCSLYEDQTEFIEQIRMHKELVWDIFGAVPTTFENTELLYNDDIARIASSLGYKGIFTEGILFDPNYVYRPAGTDIKLLLRNYPLTDDVGFRFSNRYWDQYPLTAEKYAFWLSRTPGECINIFCDYETFGEHQWIDTGIFEFMRHLPDQIRKHPHLRFSLPKEIASEIPPRREVSVSKTISWADIERDTSCWLGNALQQACFTHHERLLGPAKEAGGDHLRVWRSLSLSDHLYYIFTRGGSSGEVHSYFSPYGNPFDAAVTYFSALLDFHSRLKEALTLADHPFALATAVDRFTGEKAWSLEGLFRIISHADISSIEFHMRNGDISRWISTSIGDSGLSERINRHSRVRGKRLRSLLLREMSGHLKVKVPEA